MASNREPEPGDLIQVYRPLYQHWAIYVGGGYVVHLVPPSEGAGAGSGSIMSVMHDRALVKRERLTIVVGQDNWRVNNLHDQTHHVRSIPTIVQEAEANVGRTLSYSISSRNCEHFVTELRYGVSRSQQVEKAAEVGTGILVAGGLTALTMALLSSGSRQNRKQ